MKTYIIEGGQGRHVFFSALLPKLAEKEKVNVISSYPDVFENNPYVERSLSRNTPYMWEDLILKKDTETIFSDPYFRADFIRGECHIIDAWCRELKIDYNENLKPQLYLPNFLINDAKRFKKENGNFIIVQFTSGQSIYNAKNPELFKYEGFERNISQENAQWIIGFLKEKYPSLTILNMSFPNEGMDLQGTIRIESPTLFYGALLQQCETFIGINSCLTHMAASTDKKGVVLWGGTSHKSWGYEKDANLYGKCLKNNIACSRPYLRELGDFIGSGSKWKCPNPTCMNLDAEIVFNEVVKLISPDAKKIIMEKKKIVETKQKCRC